jgi:hypothetical protein
MTHNVMGQWKKSLNLTHNVMGQINGELFVEYMPQNL